MTETSRLEALAARLRCTEGQLYSMAIAVAASTTLVLTSGIPLGSLPATAAAGPLAPAPSAAPPAAPGVVTVPPAPPLPLPELTGVPVLPEVPTAPDPGTPVEPAPVPTGSQPSGFFSDFQVPSPGAPRALASDATHVYVGTDNTGSTPSRLLVLSRLDGSARTVTVTGQPSERTGGLSAAVVRSGKLLLTDRSRGALLELDPRTGSQRVLATLPDLPPCLIGLTGTCQPGGQDLAPSPEGLAVLEGSVFVTDSAQGTIWRYELATKRLSAWYSSSDFAGGSGPSGLAVDAGGDLVFTVAQTADLAAPLDGALYRIEVTASGPGARNLLATFPMGSAPGPVAVGRGNDVYVGLRGTGGVVAVSRNGQVAAVPGAGAAQLPAPQGLTLVDGTLLVADAGKPATPSSGRVRAVAVTDGPL